MGKNKWSGIVGKNYKEHWCEIHVEIFLLFANIYFLIEAVTSVVNVTKSTNDIV